MGEAIKLKDEGNALFKAGKFEEAIILYSKGLGASRKEKDISATLLCNRAACFLKTGKFKDCIEDCTKALEFSPTLSKAIFRIASAYEQLKEYNKCFKELNKLLHLDPTNSEGAAMMRRIKPQLMQQQQSSETMNIMESIKKKTIPINTGLNSLVGLCYDDKDHAIDFIKRGGLPWLCDLINEFIQADESSSNNDNLLSSIRILSAASNHDEFIKSAIDVGHFDSSLFDKSFKSSGLQLLDSGKISFLSVCSLLSHRLSVAIQAIMVLCMNTLKLYQSSAYLFEKGIDEGENKVSTDSYVSKEVSKALLVGFSNALELQRSESYSMVTDSFCAFISENYNYFDAEPEIDTRLESMEERKARFKKINSLKRRSFLHSKWALEAGILDRLIQQIDSSDGLVRLNASSCLGRFIHHLKEPEKPQKPSQNPEPRPLTALEEKLLEYLPQSHFQEEPSESKRVVEIVEGSDELPSIEKCRKRAALEATLLTTDPDLGSWALGVSGGVPQLLLLVATCDPRCQELAAEVICLAASSNETSSLLAPIVENNTLTTLLHSPNPGTRAAAASTITKLSLKAKALSEDSQEVSQILNASLSVLKAAVNAPKSIKSLADLPQDSKSTPRLVSFSSMDIVSEEQQKQVKTAQQQQKGVETSLARIGGSSAVAMTAVERAVEAIASMVGKSYIKEEIVHGSFRVASFIGELSKLEIDMRSSTAYGIAHIFAALTITNRELRLMALQEKNMTEEQFEQLQEIQRIKTKDDLGNPIEEKKEDFDPDTYDLCRQRIKRIVQSDGLKILVKLVEEGSTQTKETAARAMRQICVEPAIRGLFIQQGAFKACCNVASDTNNQKKTRLEAAHAIAKTLITTNPNLLSEHQRLASFNPLLFSCRDSTDVTSLQHFESLMAITNLLSCGKVEHDKFSAEKGVEAVHFLIFEDHLMVRRAATEALCNMAMHESLLRFLRDSDKVKLWLGLAEEWESEEDSEETYKTARACAGTLASSAADPETAQAMLKADCARTLVSLLDSKKPELVHRALVMILQLLSTETPGIARHLMEGGVIPAVAVVVKLQDPMLADLGKDVAQALSVAWKKEPVLSDRVEELGESVSSVELEMIEEDDDNEKNE